MTVCRCPMKSWIAEIVTTAGIATVQKIDREKKIDLNIENCYKKKIVTYPRPTMILKASNDPEYAAQCVGVIPSSSGELHSRRVVSLKISIYPSRAAFRSLSFVAQSEVIFSDEKNNKDEKNVSFPVFSCSGYCWNTKCEALLFWELYGLLTR